MLDDDTARGVLQSVLDEPAPPVTTTLDEVVRRGRRRMFMQRTSAVAGVIGVVAAIGVGAMTLRQDGGGTEVADGPTMAPPGWETVDLSERDCTRPETLPEPQIPLLSEEVVTGAFVNAVEDVTRHELMGATSIWPSDTGEFPPPRGYASVEVPMDGGNGQVMLETGRHGGTPLQAAEETIGEFGSCESVYRRTLADGTVLQLFPVTDAIREMPEQAVQIYRPDGREYLVISAGYDQAEAGPVTFRNGETPEGNGHSRLPTTQEQLATIAETLATKLGL
jgi:hypothetical protein